MVDTNDFAVRILNGGDGRSRTSVRANMNRLQNRFATSPQQDSIFAGLEPAHFNLESYCFILKILQLRVFAGGVYGIRTRGIPDRQSGGVDRWPNTP